MADKKTRPDLKNLFLSGNIPTQSDFADLIESGINQKDDGLQKTLETPLKIQAPDTTDAKAPKDLILFYEKFEDADAKWRLGTRSGGLEISRPAQSDFLIDANGSVGIGTVNPRQKLEVTGSLQLSGVRTKLFYRGDIDDHIGSLAFYSPDKGNTAIITPYDGAGKNLANSSIRFGGFGSFEESKVNLVVSGNVGIGTITAGFPLTFSNALGDKISLWGQSGNNYGFGIQSSLLQLYTDTDVADIAFGSGSSAAFKETMRVKGKGNVGIGTKIPFAGRLHIVEEVGTTANLHQGTIIIDHENDGGASSILFRSKFNRPSDYAYIQYQDRTEGVEDPESARLIIGVENDTNDHLILKPGGNVGIGTYQPTQARLVVAGSVRNTFTGFGTLTGNDAVWHGDSGQREVSIHASNSVAAPEFITFSDARIKNIIGDSDGSKDLAALLGIRITDYTFKDVTRKGDAPQKKVIAQQVEKVFPQAVSKHADVVPDIYEMASFTDGWVELATDLKKGDRVRLISEKADGVYEVLEAAKDKFRIDFKSEADKVFIFGREVDDFRTVDYDAISMLNVSAMQELYKQVQELKEKVKLLESKKSASAN